MRTNLEKLVCYLEKSNLKKEAEQVRQLTKTAVYSKSEILLRLFQNPKYQQYLINFLRTTGFVPEQDSLVSLIGAADYLKEGISENNLLLAGFSIISIIPGLENAAKLINNPNPDPDLVLDTSEMVVKNQGTIQGALNRIRDPKFNPIFKQYIPNGNLLVSYSDRIWNAIRNWAFTTQKNSTEVTALSSAYHLLHQNHPYEAWLLKKIAFSEIDFNVLQSHNLSPINGEYQQLGSGSEGVVYLVDYQGHPAAAKITYGQSVLEARKWRDILNLNLPPEYQKHLPKIYLIETNQNPNLPDHQLMVMELLVPLSGKQLDALFPDLEAQNGYYDRLSELINEPGLLDSALSYAISSSNLDDTDIQPIKTQLTNFIQNYTLPEISDNETLSKQVREDLFNFLLGILPEVESDDFSSLLDNLFDDNSSSRQVEADKIAESFVEYTYQKQFPYGHSMWQEKSSWEYFRNHPASRSLLETLLYIAEHSGIAWADVKPQNLMLRPTTGDIVIIDVGRYNKLQR